MKLSVKFLVVIFVTSCYVHLTTSLPVASTDDGSDIDDPCDLAELADIPECEDNDKECVENNERKREKRQSLCALNATCDFCETLILEDESIAPEIVLPIELSNQNSTDDEETIEIDLDLDLDLSPKNLVERNIIIENDNETQYYRGFVESGANVTTIIRLTNLIENHNIVNVPTTLNNTNINKIHIYQNKTSDEGGKFGLGYNEKGSCCYSVEPKSCKQSTAGTKCRHKRQKVCGRQCTQKVIHPKKNPPCTYTPQWPYVNCPQNQYPPFNPGFFPPGYPGYYPQVPPSQPGFEFDDDDDLPMFPEDEELENPEMGWVASPGKFKVVSEDGLTILNYTQDGFDSEHPFAQNTVSEPIKRNVRHANSQDQQTPYQNQMMPPMMFIPVYYQPMPVFMPPYYAQPPQMMPGYYQSQQIPLPPTDDSYLESNQESNEVNSYRKPKKHFKKHHPIVMEIDEEL